MTICNRIKLPYSTHRLGVAQCLSPGIWLVCTETSLPLQAFDWCVRRPASLSRYLIGVYWDQPPSPGIWLVCTKTSLPLQVFGWCVGIVRWVVCPFSLLTWAREWRGAWQLDCRSPGPVGSGCTFTRGVNPSLHDLIQYRFLKPTIQSIDSEVSIFDTAEFPTIRFDTIR